MSVRQQQTAYLYGIIGDPIGHTLSPMIHRWFAAAANCPLKDYVPFEVKSEKLADAVRGAHALGIRGMNVTVPHKSAVIPFLKAIDPLAEKIGAVNTLVYEAGGYKGYNTDVTGLKRSLIEAGAELPGLHAVILGAGGAARAAAFLLADSGAAEVILINRTREKAEALAAEVNEKTGSDCVRVMGEDDFITGAGQTGMRYLAIQCTSVGLSPDTDRSAVADPAFYACISLAVDIIYRPYQTKFLRDAAKAGCRTLNGLPMLLYQAADAFSLWFPDSGLKKEDLQNVMRALKRELLRTSGICLIGFMGSGKTTVAQALAGLLHLDVWDMDTMIEEGCGKAVSQIFAEEGEEVFRRLETDTLKRIGEVLAGQDAGSGEGLVLSTGGGLPMREENRELLRSWDMKTVYLRIRPETVNERLKDDTTRPLLQAPDKAQRVAALLAERDPVYVSCADLIVDADDGTPEEIAARILEGL